MNKDEMKAFFSSMNEDERKAFIEADMKAYYAKLLEKSDDYDLQTDDGFSKFCHYRWRRLGAPGWPSNWRPERKEIEPGGSADWHHEFWLPIDDVIESLCRTISAPRIDMSDSKWRDWKYVEGPHARFRILSDFAKNIFSKSELYRKGVTNHTRKYIDALWELESQIVGVLEQSRPEYSTIDGWRINPYFMRYSDKHEDKFVRPPWWCHEPEYKAWPKDKDGKDVWWSPHEHVDVLTRRSFERHLANLDAALKSARQVRVMAEERIKDIGASDKAKPNFAKRRFVREMAEIWGDLTGSRPSSAPDSKFAEFVSAAWISVIVNAPEESFERAIRDGVRDISEL
jgi:hypothetical protein